MKRISFPPPLKNGGCIGITAPSSGLSHPSHIARLELVNEQWRSRGYSIKEGALLRSQVKDASGSAEARAEDFLRLWKDPKVDLIVPPWGGELLVEILPLLPLEELRQSTPKWVLGYSDISTLLFALTTTNSIATAHGVNWMDLLVEQPFDITTTHERILRGVAGETFHQSSFSHYQTGFVPYEENVAATFTCTTPSQWRMLDGSTSCTMSGRLVGGCIDTLMHLVGTPYGDLPRFVSDFGKEDGVILFLENCELRPVQLARALFQFRAAGWFKGLSGIIFGRSAGPDAIDTNALSYLETLMALLPEVPCPIIHDADIGHRAPQMLIINGAKSMVSLNQKVAELHQTLA